jgi:DNA polymerase I-like protein with 3'-5' exonuclease and polymerase domains
MSGWKRLMDAVNAEANETGVSVTAAQTKRLVDGYRAMHPGLEAWWRETEHQLHTKGYLRNLFGFKRVFHNRQNLPEAVAHVPQSTIGDLDNYGLLACAQDEELKDYDFDLLLQVHDAVGYQYDSKYRLEVNTRVRKLMDKPIYIPKADHWISIPVEVAVGPNWGETQVWEDDLKLKEAA